MLQIPGTLSETTLGDVFGALHRARVDGTLEVVERGGTVHRFQWRRGNLMAADDSEPNSLHRAFELTRAQLRFRVMRSPSPGPILPPSAFLWGKPRARDNSSSSNAPHPGLFASDYYVLGLRPTASTQTVKARFRCLARRFHPDLHHRAPPEAQMAAARRFRMVAAAYERLTHGSRSRR